MQVEGQNGTPTEALRWAGFLQKTALSVGSLLLASSVISWIAANWAYASTFQKLAGTQALLVLLALLTVWLLYSKSYQRPNFSAAAQAAGLAAVCLGGLLALVGQIYQTGADPWQLFLLWAVLLLPWLLSLHTVFLGLLIAVLLNITAVLYFDAFHTRFSGWISMSWETLALVMVLVNVLMLLAWESLGRHLQDNWRLGPRLLWAAVIAWVVAGSIDNSYISLGGLALMAAAVWVYTQQRRDLMIVALAGLGVLSLIAIRLLYFIRSELGLFLIIVVLIALTGWMLAYLRRLVAADNRSQVSVDQPDHQDQLTTQGDSWYISLFRVPAMVLTATLILVFLYITLDSVFSQSWLVGVVVTGLGLLLSRIRTVGVLYEAGATVACAGLFVFVGGLYDLDSVALAWRVAGLAVFAVLIYTLGRGFALRWFSAVFSLMVLFAMTWPGGGWDDAALDVLLDYGITAQVYFPAYLRLWWLAVFAILTLVISRNSSLSQTWSPLAWALVVLTQLTTALVPATGLQQLASYWPGEFQLLLLALACAILPLFTLTALLWPMRTLPVAVRIGAPVALAVACLAWMGAPGIAMGLLWLILGFAQQRRALILFGAVSILGYLGAYYYQLEVSLLHKSFLLGVTGLWLLAALLVLRRVAGVSVSHLLTVSAAPGVSRRRIAGVLAGLLLMLVVVNTSIYQKEQILVKGQTVVLQLAPVDPRSLMQGDYMALRFYVAIQLNSLWGTLPDQIKQDINDSGVGYVVLVPDADGVYQLEGIRSTLDGPVIRSGDQASGQQPSLKTHDNLNGAVTLQFRRRDGRTHIVTDAWFFPEGKADHFDQAKYGEVRVSADGVGLLKRMLDGDMKPL